MGVFLEIRKGTSKVLYPLKYQLEKNVPRIKGQVHQNESF